MDVWVFCIRPSVVYQLARGHAMVDCRLPAQRGIGNRACACIDQHGPNLLANWTVLPNVSMIDDEPGRYIVRQRIGARSLDTPVAPGWKAPCLRYPGDPRQCCVYASLTDRTASSLNSCASRSAFDVSPRVPSSHLNSGLAIQFFRRSARPTRLHPQLSRYLERIQIGGGPPPGLVARAMQLTVVGATKRNSELVAHFAAERTRLGKPQVMRVGRPAATQQAWLRRHEAEVGLVAASGRCRDCKTAVVDLIRVGR